MNKAFSVFVVVVFCLIAVLFIVAVVKQADFRHKCEQAGGVMVVTDSADALVCVDRKALMEVPK